MKKIELEYLHYSGDLVLFKISNLTYKDLYVLVEYSLLSDEDGYCELESLRAKQCDYGQYSMLKMFESYRDKDLKVDDYSKEFLFLNECLECFKSDFEIVELMFTNINGREFETTMFNNVKSSIELYREKLALENELEQIEKGLK